MNAKYGPAAAVILHNTSALSMDEINMEKENCSKIMYKKMYLYICGRFNQGFDFVVIL